MNTYKANPAHEVAYQDLCKLAAKNAPGVSALELLAIAANMLGKMIAMQDQRTLTPDQALSIVLENMELGNQQVMEQLSNTQGEA